MKRVALFALLAFVGPAVAKAPAPKASAQESFDDAEDNFRAALDLVLKRHRDDGLTRERLYQLATAGMLEKLSGNPEWSRLLTPRENQELLGELRGRVIGVGIELDFNAEAGLANVRAVIPGGAAEDAGIRSGDRILKVDDQSLRSCDLAKVVAMIRGPEGSSVKLRLLRDDRVLDVDVRRRALAWNPVDTRALPGGTWLVTIKAFNDNVPEGLAEAARSMQKAGAKALIVDLRGNAGGGVTPAMKSAAAFLPKSTEVTTATYRGGKRETFASPADGDGPLAQLPLAAVLVNEHTSSSAEIIAEALRQQRHAPLVGRKTLGKWNGQTVEELPNGFAARFTVMTFAAPNGRSYDGVGVVPDVEVAMDAAIVDKARLAASEGELLAQDAQLRAALKVAGIEAGH